MLSLNNIQNNLEVLNIGNHNSGGNPHSQYKLIEGSEPIYLGSNYNNSYIKICDLFIIGNDNYVFSNLKINVYCLSNNQYMYLDFNINKNNNTITFNPNTYCTNSFNVDNIKFITESNTIGVDYKIGIYMLINATNQLYSFEIEKNINKGIKILLNRNENIYSISTLNGNEEFTIIKNNNVVKTTFSSFSEGFSENTSTPLIFSQENNLINVNGSFKIDDITKTTVCYYSKTLCPFQNVVIPFILHDVYNGKRYNGILTFQKQNDNRITIQTTGLPDGYTKQGDLICYVNTTYYIA